MTRKSKRPADIKTDRSIPELPILDRLLPIEPIITERLAASAANDGPATDGCPASRLVRGSESTVKLTASADGQSFGHREGQAPTDRWDDPAFQWPDDSRGAVSINREYLEYERPLDTRSWSRRLLTGLLPAFLLAGLVTIAVVVFSTVVSTSEAAGAVGPTATGLQPGPLQEGSDDGGGQPSDGPLYASIGLEAKVQPALAVDGAGCLNSPAAPVAPGQAVTFCYLVTNLGTTYLTDITVADESLGLDAAELPLASGERTLGPGEQAVFYHHAVAGERAGRTESIVTAQPVDQNGEPVVDLVAPSGIGSPGGVADPSTPIPEDSPSASSTEPATTPLDESGSTALVPAEPVAPSTDQTDNSNAPNDAQGSPPGSDGSPLPADEQPAIAAAAAEPQATDVSGQTDRAGAHDDGAIPTQLAMTGVRTEPWIMVILAMGLIFIGYTAVVAYTTSTAGGRDRGHDQLDSLGFD